MEPTRNSAVLADFVEYCSAHPQERFWQALRNWCGYSFVIVTEMKGIREHYRDTFHWEGKNQ